MTAGLLVELGWKSLMVAGVTLLLLRLVEGRSAADKSLLADAGILSLLLLPLTSFLLPQIELAPPQAISATIDSMSVESAMAAPVMMSPGPAPTASALPWGMIAITLYAATVMMLIALLAVSLIRLHRIRGASHAATDIRWVRALEAAERRSGSKRRAALLSCDSIASPMSWGLVRPVIVVDAAAFGDAGRIDAIIAHELAHVHRFDWLRLVLARVMTAIFWFNPLAWLLARASHQLREEAADDAVIRADLGKTDYAGLLVATVRHAQGWPDLAAHGVAPSQSSIARRVRHILDRTSSRAPTTAKWSLTALALATMVNATFAAAQPVRVASFGLYANAGERAAASLQRIAHPSAQSLAQAIRARDLNAGAPGTGETFSEPRAIQPLILALRDDHPAVRRIALWGLSQMRPGADPIAVPAVSELLYDRVAAVRADAAEVIGKFESVRNSRSIEKMLLGDPSPEVRARAAQALGNIADPGSSDSLEASAADPDPRVRQSSGEALRRLSETAR